MPIEKREGICHICGDFGTLSKEHVPPKSAFNNRRTVEVKLRETITLGPDEVALGPIHQGGVFFYTLCPRCNNLTGHWYGGRFVDWCYQGMHILFCTRGKPSLVYLNYLFPLAIIKEVIAMFFSVNSERFRLPNQELEKFVMNRDARYLSPKYRFFVYYNTDGHFRYIGLTGQLNVFTGRRILISEISYPPFGYVMTIDSEPPDSRLFEITHFAEYRYEEFAVMELRLPTLPTHTMYPGDYRTMKELKELHKKKT
jgi:hypothetical protein